MSSSIIRIAPEVMLGNFENILKPLGFTPEKASAIAQVFVENSLDGVYSHGVNRFRKFVQYIRDGHINVKGEPERVHSSGVVEQWEGHAGPGILNALRCSERALDIAAVHGMGCVALAHTNHWMRGGTYGWRVAKRGYVYIGWTNTISNMPPWGGTDPRLGNNPLVIAVPYKEEAIVLDMAMSQFSYGSLEQKKMSNERLPVPGGYNSAGDLSYDASEILETERVLPVGFWKGSGFSLLLDILATALSGGHSVKRITDQGAEYNLSQVFIAIAINGLSNSSGIGAEIAHIITDYHQASRVREDRPVLYPGERVLVTRSENIAKGIPVIERVWEEIVALQHRDSR